MKEQEKLPGSKMPVRVSRRKFLTGIGAGAAGTIVAPAGALAQEGTLTQIENVTVTPTRTDRFTRIFNLRPFAEPSAAVQQALLRVWRAWRAARRERSARNEGPVRLITNPELSPNNRDNPAVHGRHHVSRPVPRSRHDVRRGVETRRADGARARDQYPDTIARSRFGVRRRSRYQSAALRSERPGQVQGRTRRRVRGFAAVGRNNRAIIADPRNDENMMISGLQVGLPALPQPRRRYDSCGWPQSRRTVNRRGRGSHLDARRDTRGGRRAAKRLRQGPPRGHLALSLDHHQRVPARRSSALRWWRDILTRGRRFYTPRRGRAEHPRGVSRPRPTASVTAWSGRRIAPTWLATPANSRSSASSSTPPGEGQADPVDLRGGARARRRPALHRLADLLRLRRGPDFTHVRPPKVIDTKISTALFNLPLGAIASGDAPTSLPQRNLLRHLTWSMPSGQAIARADEHRADQAWPLERAREVRHRPGAKHAALVLRAQGGRARRRAAARRSRRANCGEVFCGLLALDENWSLSENPRWRPTLPRRVPGTFTTADLLTFAGRQSGKPRPIAARAGAVS